LVPIRREPVPNTGFICWLGRTPMSRDALFQLGMGSVLLRTSQEEDTLRTFVPGALRGISSHIATLPLIAAVAPAERVRVNGRHGGNSAKALHSPPAATGTS